MPLHQPEVSPTAESGFDANRRYVRVCERRADGFVEFEFAIGDPALCVELMLKEGDFHTFWLNRASLHNGEETGEKNEVPTTKGHTHGN